MLTPYTFNILAHLFCHFHSILSVRKMLMYMLFEWEGVLRKCNVLYTYLNVDNYGWFLNK